MRVGETVYIGDGVYATLDPGNMIKLYTDREDGTRHYIYLEPEVFRSLVKVAIECAAVAPGWPTKGVGDNT